MSGALSRRGVVGVAGVLVVAFAAHTGRRRAGRAAGPVAVADRRDRQHLRIGGGRVRRLGVVEVPAVVTGRDREGDARARRRADRLVLGIGRRVARGHRRAATAEAHVRDFDVQPHRIVGDPVDSAENLGGRAAAAVVEHLDRVDHACGSDADDSGALIARRDRSGDMRSVAVAVGRSRPRIDAIDAFADVEIGM